MATITYQCNTCKRILQKLENKQGMTVFSKCIITDGCHGKLYKIDRNIDNSRESFPSEVLGLSDYSPRKAFYRHDQTLSSKTWRVEHNLSTSPAITVYIKNTSNELVLLNQDEYVITIADNNTVNLTFTQNYTGTAQCIARSTTISNVQTKTTITNIQVTSNGVLTIAVPEIMVNDYPIPSVDMISSTFQLSMITEKPSSSQITSVESFSASLVTGLSWSDTSKIIIRKRKNYVVRHKNILSLSTFLTLKAGATTLPNGTKLYFTDMQIPHSGMVPIDSRKLLFLLSKSPFASVDKVKNQFVDVGEMLDTTFNYFTYIDGELYVNSVNVENTYPDIVKVT